jgi:hypothetical protein
MSYACFRFAYEQLMAVDTLWIVLAPARLRETRTGARPVRVNNILKPLPFD